jgi:hypothetical protein
MFWLAQQAMLPADQRCWLPLPPPHLSRSMPRLIATYNISLPFGKIDLDRMQLLCLIFHTLFSGDSP